MKLKHYVIIKLIYLTKQNIKLYYILTFVILNVVI